MEERNYKAVLEYCNKDIEPIEKIKLIDVSDAISLDTLIKDSASEAVVIDVAYYGVINVHNEKSKDKKDYDKIVIVDTEKRKYVTGSKSFLNSLQDIYENLNGLGIDNPEKISIKVYKRSSKNYSGDFITCSLW